MFLRPLYSVPVLVIIALASLGVGVVGYNSPGNPSGFVNDFAGVIDDDTESRLEQQLVEYEQESSTEIAVVTIDSYGDDEVIETYAVKLFEEYTIGKEGVDNGVLLLVAVDDRELRIEVGYGLEGALTDLESKSIINDVITPEFRADNYTKGIDNGVQAIIEATEGEYTGVGVSDGGEGTEAWFIALMFLSFIFGGASRGVHPLIRWALSGLIGAGLGLGLALIFGPFGVLGALAAMLLGAIFVTILGYMPIANTYGPGRGQGGIHRTTRSNRSSGSSFGGFGGGRSGGGGASGGW